MLLGYDDEIIEKIENMSDAETKKFSHQLLDNYILGNEVVVRLYKLNETLENGPSAQ